MKSKPRKTNQSQKKISMKTMLKTSALLLTFLFLQSCSSDDDSSSNLQDEDKTLQVELIPIAENPEDFQVMTLGFGFTVDNPIDMTPDDYELGGNTGGLAEFYYTYDNFEETYRFETTGPIKIPVVSITIASEGTTEQFREVFTVNIYADNELFYTYTIGVDAGTSITQYYLEANYRNK